MHKSVKILVCYHKKDILFKDDVLTPIHLGRAIALKKNTNQDIQWLLENMIGDDTGDNISLKNPSYNELTAIYWAWKNYDKLGNPDYIGFMHYRRHFIFRNNDKQVEIVDRVGDDYFDFINYNQKTIEKLFSDCDFIAHIGHVDNVYKHYKENHHIEDLDLAIAILKKKHPSYSRIADDYIKMSNVNFCNMFIMPKNMFFEYCAWLFDILGEFEKKVDLSEKRLFISERLTGIFIEYKKRQGFKQKALPSTFIKSNITVPIAISYNGNDFCTAVTMYSIMKHKDINAFVKFYLLNKGENCDALIKLFDNREDCSIEAINVPQRLKDKKLFLPNMQFPQHYPIVVSELVTDNKVLFVDERVLFFGDVSNFFSTCNNDEFWVLGMPKGNSQHECYGTAFSLNSGRLRSHEFLKSLNDKCFQTAAAEIFNKYAKNQVNSFPWWLYNVTNFDKDGQTWYDVPRAQKRWGVWERPLLYFDEEMEPWNNIQGLYSKYWWEIANEIPATVKFTNQTDAGTVMYKQSRELCAKYKTAIQETAIHEDVLQSKKENIIIRTYRYFKLHGFKQTIKKIISKLGGGCHA